MARTNAFMQQFPRDIEIYKFRRLMQTKEQDDDSQWPHPRSGHRAIASNSKFWVLGGYNPKNLDNEEFPLFRETWMYNIWTHKWKKLDSDPAMPHTLASQAVIKHSDYMIAMGGTGYPFGLDKSSNDISVCHLKSGKWKQIETGGVKPEKVYGQSMVLNNNTLYVYGGTSGFEYTSDLHRLDMETMLWERIEPNNDIENFPPTRYRHEMVLYNDQLFVLGGGTSIIAYDLETVWIYSINKNIWEEKPTIPDPTYTPWSDHGYPRNRRCHSCVLWKGKAYVCGGYNSQKIYPDLWQLDLNTLQWKFLSTMEQPLYFHSAAVTTDGCMMVFGGVSVQERRNNTLYRVWLGVPTLATLCVNSIVRHNPHVVYMSQQQLLEVGLSPILSTLLNGSSPGG